MSASLWCDEEGRVSHKPQLRAQWDPSVSGGRVINRLLQSEERYLLSPLYISLIQREPHRREELAKWVLEVCSECGCEESVYALSVSLLDRFLSASLSLPVSPLCLSAACILIASKVTGSEPVSAGNLCAAANFCFLPNNLRDMERVVLATLRWDVAVVTPHDFLPHFLFSLERERVEEDGQTDRDSQALLSTLRRHVDTLVAMCVCDSRFLGIPPSLIAAAALNAALSGLGSKGLQLGTNELATLCQIDLGVLQYYTELIEGALTEHLRSGPRERKMCPEVEKEEEALEEIDTERASTPTDLREIDF
ncbi:G1/S-specific cyclin-D1-like [Anguilla anguilla]|uniref:G1/S-specific cyclin-D1-like n=1 Tax=Anguilla anguilla TaxID=7936 RepID=UPI0015B0C759|nr:G1/S-specific cyclin-D1-like [Anguilla anguilla]